MTGVTGGRRHQIAKCSRRALIGSLGALPVAAAASAISFPRSAITVERLAWAGIKLETPGVAIFIDAVAPSDDAPGPALHTTAERAFALVTHAHGDHCDPAALRPVLGDNGYIVAQEDVARFINPQGVLVQPVPYFEPVFLSRAGGEFVAWCVPAADGLGSPQCSWIVEGGGKRIIHCGDTMWNGGFWDDVRAYGPFDAAFLPINGMRQTLGRFRDVTQPMSMTPDQAAAAALILKPAVTVPIHYGSHGNPNYVEVPDAEQRFLAEMARLKLNARVMKPGESLQL
jgi:L-ascorbate metabolism protein UlaG (beta-lactamase superfamily)